MIFCDGSVLEVQSACDVVTIVDGDFDFILCCIAWFGACGGNAVMVDVNYFAHGSVSFGLRMCFERWFRVVVYRCC